MTTQLTTLQTEKIAAYCSQHGLIWYDVKLEVVDHIAAWIEQEMAATGLDFDNVYNAMQAAFPKQELMLVVKEKKKNIVHRISRSLRKEMLSFFTVPRIFLTALLFTLAIVLPTIFSAAVMRIFFSVLFSLFLLFIFFPYLALFTGIKKIQRYEVLSVKVKTGYDWMIWVIAIAFNLVPLKELLKTLINPKDHLQEVFVFRLLGVFFVGIFLLGYCTAITRKKLIYIIMAEYPNAFAS